MKGKFEVLLVEDDKHVVTILRRAFASVFPQADLVVVGSFAQAVTYWHERGRYRPGLILLDLDLQVGPSGFDLLSWLRGQPTGRLGPIVILTGNESAKVIDTAYEQGASAFTLKPSTYPDWKFYVEQLKEYWYEVAAKPQRYVDSVAQNYGVA